MIKIYDKMLLSIKILIFISFLSYIFSLKTNKFIYILISSQIVIYLFIISLSPLNIYSDREQYVYWFLNVDEFFGQHSDIFFSFILKIISFISTNISLFFLIFGIIIISIISAIVKNLGFRLLLIAIFFLLLIPNRFFLEFSLNSMRSFFLIVCYIYIAYHFFVRNSKIVLLFVPFLYYIHGSMFLLISLTLIIYKFIKHEFLLRIFFILISTLFFLGVNINIFENFFFDFISYYMNQYRYESSDMFLETGNYYHFIARIQIFISYITIMIILLCKVNKMSTFDKNILYYCLFIFILVILTSLTFPIIFRLMAFILLLLFLLFAKYYKRSSYIDNIYVILSFFINSLVYIKNYKGLIE